MRKRLFAKLFLVLGLVLAFTAAPADEQQVPVSGNLKVDLGTVVESGHVAPVDGISAAGQPDAAALKVFADNGYVAVIDLRTPGESRGLDEPAVVEELGMDYVALPTGADDITFERAQKLEDILVRYDQPVLVHCGSGNRVGALLALQAYRETHDAEAALEKGRRAGLTRLDSKVRKVMNEK